MIEWLGSMIGCLLCDPYRKCRSVNSAQQNDICNEIACTSVRACMSVFKYGPIQLELRINLIDS